MTLDAPLPRFETHAVDNQTPEFAPRDLWAFCRSRVDGRHGLAFGTLETSADIEEAMARVAPNRNGS